MKTILIFFPLFLILIISGCSKEDKTPDGESVSQSGNVHVPEVFNVTGRTDMAPNFSWKDAAGKETDFDSFRGKVTLVNFWATWCAPCKKELPDLIELSRELADRGVVFLGIATDRVTSDVSPFVAKYKIPYTILLSNEDIEEYFGNIRVVPTTFLINPEGKIVETILGARSKEQCKERILAHL